jgi:hypothetical protein
MKRLRIAQPHRYTYFVLSGPLFAGVMVPQSSVPGARSITLGYSGKNFSLLPGQKYSFDHPVNLFTLHGLTNSPTKKDFASKVSFASAGLAIFAHITLPPGDPLLAGDLNGDGKVDCSDLSLVKAFLGKNASQSGFDPRADADGDGVVDLTDVSIVASQLPPGMKCP